MPKNTTSRLQLATSEQGWREMDAQIADSVRTICGRYHDREQVEAFLFLIDLLTNPDYDAIDRGNALLEVHQCGFTYTAEFEQAREAYLNNLNPSRAREAKTA